MSKNPWDQWNGRVPARSQRINCLLESLWQHGALDNCWLICAHLFVKTPSQRHGRAARSPTTIGSTAAESSLPDRQQHLFMRRLR